MGMLLHRHMKSLQRDSEVIQKDDIEPEITVEDEEDISDEKPRRGRPKLK